MVNVNERSFQIAVLELAALHGWLCYHTHDSRRSQPGFPDLVLVRDSVVFAELKTETGRVSAAQANWQKRLEDAGAEHHLWRPSDWDAIVARLTMRT